MNLRDKMDAVRPPAGRLAIHYLGQAGFVVKRSNGRTIMIDPYFSELAKRLFGFKRMSPPPTGWERFVPDDFLATHAHVDHLDTDSLPIFVKNPGTFFVGAPDCREPFKAAGLTPDRFAILREGETWLKDGISIRGIAADHGELAPDALGLLVETDGLSIYDAGDTALIPDRIAASLATEIDVLIAPINGAFGNLTASDAVALAERLRPKTVIASHFWMFLEHVAPGGVGDPTTFLTEAKKRLTPLGIQSVVLAPGETFLV